MPTIKVNTDKIRSYAAEMTEVLQEMRSIEAEYANTYTSLDWEIRAEADIDHRLTSIQTIY